MESKSWDEEFIEAYNSFPKIIEEPFEYRIHYDEDGRIVMLTHQNHPDSIQYLIVSADEYADYQHYYVDIEKKQLKKVAHNPGLRVQLKRSDQGSAVVKNHAGLVLEPGETSTEVDHYDNTTNRHS